MFLTPKMEERGFPATAVAIGAGALVLLVVSLSLLGRHDHVATQSTTLRPAAVYAANLPLSSLAMSEAKSFSGAKQMYIDGRITNNGSSTVTGATVQVVFGNVVGNPPRIETAPVMLIRSREPYVDVEPIGSDPLKPGKSDDFRLTFENVDPNWDQQLPEVRMIRVGTK
jgi:hypothetical protein